jgi:hypothetical protein
MAIDYGLDDDYGFGVEDASMMGGVLMAKITVKTTDTPVDYSGVPRTTTTTEEIPLPALGPEPGPAPMMMAVPPPGLPGVLPPGLPEMPVPGMANPAMMPPGMVPPQSMPAGQPMSGTGSMGANAAAQVMQQFG